MSPSGPWSNVGGYRAPSPYTLRCGDTGALRRAVERSRPAASLDQSPIGIRRARRLVWTSICVWGRTAKLKTLANIGGATLKDLRARRARVGSGADACRSDARTVIEALHSSGRIGTPRASRIRTTSARTSHCCLGSRVPEKTLGGRRGTIVTREDTGQALPSKDGVARAGGRQARASTAGTSQR